MRHVALVLPAALLASCYVNNTEPDDTANAFFADPDAVDFGYVEAGTVDPPVQEIELINNTRSTVDIEGIQMAEGSAEAFSLLAVPSSLPHPVPADSSVIISVFFSPASVGEFLGTVQVATNDDEYDVVTIELGGCSTSADCSVDVGDDDDSVPDDDDSVPDDDDDTSTSSGDISVNPTTVAFGDVPANQNPPADVVAISNVGGGALTIDSITVTGPDASRFTAGGFNGGTLQPNGAPANLQVSFNAGGAPLGAKSATLVIESSDPDEATVNVPLSANVVEDCGACTPTLTIVGATESANPLDGTTLRYLQISQGSIQVTVQNSGQGTLNVNSVTEGGTIVQDNPGMQYTGGAPLSLDANETGTLNFSINADGCEVVNFDGAYAFTMGTVADAFSCVLGGP
jgi:hypothetical protein